MRVREQRRMNLHFRRALMFSSYSHAVRYGAGTGMRAVALALAHIVYGADVPMLQASREYLTLVP